MSYFVNAARTVAAASLVGGFACLGPATATADPSDALAGMLSKGYSPSNCELYQPGRSGELAEYECANNADPSGPGRAVYWLFANTSGPADAFEVVNSTVVLTACPNNGPSPTTWHYDNTPDTPAGQLACAKTYGAPEVVWTQNENHMAAFILGGHWSDVAPLYQWWTTNR
jgi:hypothetical protein